ncbi:MAG: zinc-ribbon domain-containing protein [Clostridium sp.]
MFCTKCGTKVDDDALFCTSCGEGLNNKGTSSSSSGTQFHSPISSEEIKTHTFLSLSIFKKQLSAPKILEENLSYSKNLMLLLSLIVLLPLISVVFTAIIFNLSRASRYFYGDIQFSMFFKLFFVGVLFLALLIFLTGGLMIPFTKGRLSFDNVVRAATLPMVNLLIFSILNLLLSLLSITLGIIASLIGFLTFLFSYFNGIRYFAKDSELLPISFSGSLGISFFISSLILSSIVGSMLARSLPFF